MTVETTASPPWVAAVRTASRIVGVMAAGLILVSIGVICQMVFVRAVLGESSIWQTEFVTFAIVGATFLGAPYILLTHGQKKQIALRMDDEFRGSFSVKALNPTTLAVYCSLKLETDYTE